MESLQRRFQAARDAASYGRSPALAIYLMGKQIGMTDEEILAEYEKDCGERKLIVETILGKEEKDHLSRYFLRQYMSRFMQYGYAEETLLISALRHKIGDDLKPATVTSEVPAATKKVNAVPTIAPAK